MAADECPPRVLGLETEYGCLVNEGQHIHRAISKVRDWIFDQGRYGLIDVHHRDWDEPPGNGGFLFNGGRAYEDMGHLEMCTPECASALEVVYYDRANDAILEQALTELELTESVSLIRNNVDHYTGATFGCHENYSMQRNAPIDDESIFSLLTFLTLRSLYTGAGRVGGLEDQRYDRTGPERSPLLENYEGFQISQRADYVENDFFRWVQGNRAIINTRDEPLADPNRYRRLHLLHGDTNVLPAAAFLKLGTTTLILDLLEIDALPKHRLTDPVRTLKFLSYHPDGPWEVSLTSDTSLTAIEVLEFYRESAKKFFHGRDSETDLLLDLWSRTNEGLASDPTSLVGILDWVTKKYLFEAFCQSEGILMGDPWLESQDLEYHNVLADQSLGLPLSQPGTWHPDPQQIHQRLTEPPKSTRASARSRLMSQIRPKDEDYIIDWDSVRWGKKLALLLDPYELNPKVETPPAEPFTDLGED